MKSRWIASGVLMCLLMTVSGLTAELTEADVTYISNVVTKLDSYVSWAEDKKLEGDGDLMVITAIGSSPLYDKLKKSDGEKTAEGRVIKFRNVDPDWMPANSHILIFVGLETERTKKLISLLEGKGSFCITLGAGNSTLGSAVNFVGGAKVTTELNLKVAKREGFVVKPSFLKVAKVVEK